MCVMRAGKRHLTCANRHDADRLLCVILRHLRHPMTHAVTRR